MSIQQGLISPPLSGRTYKADQPRIKDIHTAVKAVDVFGGAPSSSSAVHHSESGFEHRHHTIRSPVKKQYDHLSDADRAVRPLTPPMSKDVRHDDQSRQRQDPNGHYRLSSEADHLDAQPCSFSTSQVDIEAAPVEVRTSQPSVAPASASKSGLLEAARVGNRFDTLNQGIGFESDDEHNPFLDRRRTAAPSSSSTTTTEVSKATASAHTQAQPHAHHSHPYYDDFDSDQDAEGSVHEDDIRDDATPRASSSNPTTPPARTRPITYRPARPFSARVRVDNQPVTSIMPIRDTPKNPFLAGGPADNGFHGPNGHLAYRRAKHIPGKERGKIAYVFRGQRVIYADPEYAADDDDDDSDEERARTNQFNPHHNPNRPPRLQPKLLFPPTASASSLAACQNSTKSVRMGSAMQYSAAPSAGRRSNASSAYLPRAELAEDAFGGSTSSSSYEEESYAPRTGGGLFAAQIAAKHKQEMAAPKATASYSSRTHHNEREEYYPPEQHHVEEASTARHHYTDQREHREAIAPSSSARLQSVTHDIQSNRDARQAGFEGRQAARDALLARLDQTNWSDDEEEEDDRHNDAGGGHDHSFSSRRRHARCGSEGTVEEQEYLVESHILPRSQSQHKRLSEELHPGHADEVDVSGRPMKRSRASFAY
ncbi:uncharacterized protein UTRI_04555_B [Ustilago trichophora]|uniref:Uncharacterized protein n=1 Tax=Ustilago trichophora TaxID=86804 RepID=A0A5C3EER5_9BASI|nr:uncharacterized protein UTRI_04555_B [Ustilago trichophora]